MFQKIAGLSPEWVQKRRAFSGGEPCTIALAWDKEKNKINLQEEEEEEEEEEEKEEEEW